MPFPFRFTPQRSDGSQDHNGNPSFNTPPQDDTSEDEGETWINDTVLATHNADDLMTAHGIPTAGQDSSRGGAQRYMTKQEGCRKCGRPINRWEDDIHSSLQPSKVRNEDLDSMNDTTWLTTTTSDGTAERATSREKPTHPTTADDTPT